MRRIRALLTGLVLVATLATGSAAMGTGAYPETVPLPTGFQPEGVAIGGGHDVYAGAIFSGAIWKGDLRTGEGGVLVPGRVGRMSLGMFVDDRSGNLFVAGGFTAASYVYDGDTGEDVATLDMPGGFLNDVIVTRHAAYFTDSFTPSLYRVPLGPGGAVASGQATRITLGGDWEQGPEGTFNANGIEATSDGRWLIVVNSTTGKLYRVDPMTGMAKEIDLDGASLPAGDGVRLVGNTLYVVQPDFNQIAVVRLDPGLASGTIVQEITSPLFRVPTTADVLGSSLYAVNARFDVAPPGDVLWPDVEFEIVRVSRN